MSNIHSSSQEAALEILGAENFIGTKEAAKYYRVNFEDEILTKLNNVPFPEKVLKQGKNTHILVAGFPLTILDMRHKEPSLIKYGHDDNIWYLQEDFVKKEKVGICWYFIRKNEAPNTTKKTFQQGKLLLPEHVEVPKACVVVYAVNLYFMHTGERLFENIRVRCADSLTTEGDTPLIKRVEIGYNNKEGLEINAYDQNYTGISVGIAESWKI